MKKTLTLALLTILCFAARSQTFKVTSTFTDEANTSMLDAYNGFAVGTKGANIRIMKRDANGAYAVIHDDVIAEGIDNALLNTDNNIVTVLIETPQRIIGKRLTPSGVGYVAQTTDLTSMNGTIDHNMIARRSSKGISFIHQYRWGITGPVISKIGTFNFDGSFVKNIGTYDTLSKHTAIISDNSNHYVFSYQGTEVFMEKRNNDANLSYNNGYFLGPLYRSNTDLTDVFQTDTTVRALVRYYPDTIIEKIIWKTNGVSTETRIPYAVSPTTHGEEYIFARVLMAQNKIVQHTPDLYGNSKVTNTTTFPGTYTRFTTYPVSNYYFIWVGSYEPNVPGSPTVILMDEWLGAKHTATLGNASDIHIMKGGYQQDANTFIVYGDKISGGTRSGVIYTLGFENISTEVIHIQASAKPKIIAYPNPAQGVLNIKCADHEKIERIVIRDMLDNPVRDYEGNGSSEQQLSLYQLASAHYIAEVELKRGTTTHIKFVKIQ